MDSYTLNPSFKADVEELDDFVNMQGDDAETRGMYTNLIKKDPSSIDAQTAGWLLSGHLNFKTTALETLLEQLATGDQVKFKLKQLVVATSQGNKLLGFLKENPKALKQAIIMLGVKKAMSQDMVEFSGEAKEYHSYE